MIMRSRSLQSKSPSEIAAGIWFGTDEKRARTNVIGFGRRKTPLVNVGIYILLLLFLLLSGILIRNNNT